MNIHRTKLESLIKGSKGKIFSCVFIKKDGTFRTMSCRLGVKKGVKGTGKPIHDRSNSYLTVWDIGKKSYRIINLNTLLSIKTEGEVYHVTS